MRIDAHKNSHIATAFNSYFNIVVTITFTNNFDCFNDLLAKLEKLAKDETLHFGHQDSQS